MLLDMIQTQVQNKITDTCISKAAVPLTDYKRIKGSAVGCAIR